MNKFKKKTIRNLWRCQSGNQKP